MKHVRRHVYREHVEWIVDLRVASLTVVREWLLLSDTATALRKDCEHGRH